MFVHSALISSRVYVVRVSLCSLSGPPSCCVSLHPSVPTLLCYLVCFCFLHLIASKIKAEISSLIPFESSILGPLPACHTPYPVTKTGYKKYWCERSSYTKHTYASSVRHPNQQRHPLKSVSEQIYSLYLCFFKQCNKSMRSYLDFIMGISKVMFSTTVAFSSQAFWEA